MLFYILLADVFVRSVFLLPGVSEGIVYSAFGTGRTTGHVVTLNVLNVSTSEREVQIGPYLIPSADTTQGYMIPDGHNVRILPGQTIQLALEGYCTNPFLPPVREAGHLRKFRDWVEADRSIVVRPGMNLTIFKGYEKKPDLHGDSLYLLYPGTEHMFEYKIDIDVYPQTSAALVKVIIDSIESAYSRMESENRIRTPFHSDPEKQKETVIQQSFWIAVSLLRGHQYTFEQLRANLIRQYEKNMGRPYDEFSEALKRDLDRGLATFWSTFVQVGEQAAVLKMTN